MYLGHMQSIVPALPIAWYRLLPITYRVQCLRYLLPGIDCFRSHIEYSACATYCLVQIAPDHIQSIVPALPIAWYRLLPITYRVQCLRYLLPGTDCSRSHIEYSVCATYCLVQIAPDRIQSIVPAIPIAWYRLLPTTYRVQCLLYLLPGIDCSRPYY